MALVCSPKSKICLILSILSVVLGLSLVITGALGLFDYKDFIDTINHNVRGGGGGGGVSKMTTKPYQNFHNGDSSSTGDLEVADENESHTNVTRHHHFFQHHRFNQSSNNNHSNHFHYKNRTRNGGGHAKNQAIIYYFEKFMTRFYCKIGFFVQPLP